MKRDNKNAINALCLFVAAAATATAVVSETNRQPKAAQRYSTMRARHSVMRVKTVTLHIIHIYSFTRFTI